MEKKNRYRKRPTAALALSFAAFAASVALVPLAITAVGRATGERVESAVTLTAIDRESPQDTAQETLPPPGKPVRPVRSPGFSVPNNTTILHITTQEATATTAVPTAPPTVPTEAPPPPAQAETGETVLSAEAFRRLGKIAHGGFFWTWYSEKVLPGGGLSIPGRHVDESGFVCDAQGFICLSSSVLGYGTVLATPFGKSGKVYDSGCAADIIDVYVSW